MPSSSGDRDAAFEATAASGDAALEATAASGTDERGPAADLATMDAPAAPTVASPAAVLPVVEAGRYRIDGEVGRGGLGRVMRARDRVLDRTVAVKELQGADDGARRRFVREALITARLQHPAIVPVYDAGRWRDQSPFYAMKLVGGRSLGEVIAGTRTLAERLALLPSVLAVADAVGYAHGQRIVHRDLKPGNVLVGEHGETVVIDWGLAKDLAANETDEVGTYAAVSADATHAGAVLGTPAYMAPEQAAGEAIDERADVYAVGAILYHLLAGTAPHQGRTLEEVIARVLAGDVEPLARRVADVPADLATIVGKAMALEVARRYPTARELAEDLRRFTTGQLVGAHRYTVGERVRRWVRRHRAVATVAVVAVVVLGAYGAWSVRRIVQETRRADVERDQARAAANELRVELGRTEMLADRPGEALAHLIAARRAGVGGAGVEVLIGDATRSLDDLVAVVGHGGERVYAVAAIGGGRGGIVTGAVDGSVAWWDADGGARGRAETGASVEAVVPVGGRVATGHGDGAIRIWRDAGTAVAVLDGGDAVAALAASEDGAVLVSAHVDGVARVWDVATGTRVAELRGHADPVNDVAITADGAMIATAGDDGTARLWDRSGAVIATLDAHQSAVLAVRFAPGGERVVTTADDGLAIVWPVGGGAPVRLVGHAGRVWTAAFSPDGAMVATAGFDGTVRVWDAVTGVERAVLVGHGDAVRAIAFVDGGARLVSASRDATARVWDVASATSVVTLQGHEDGIDAIAIVRAIGGDRIVTAAGDGTARIWRLDRSAVDVRIAPEGGVVYGAVFAKDDRLAAGGEGGAWIWPAGGGAPVALEGHDATVIGVGFAGDDRVVTASIDGVARLASARDGARVAAVGGGGGPLSSAVARPEVGWIATASVQGEVAVWNLDGSLRFRLGVPEGGLARVTADRAGGRIVTFTEGGVVELWDAADGERIATLVGAEVEVNDVAFSPDGALVAAAVEHAPRVWRAVDGAEVARCEGHRGAVMSVAFTRDGGGLVSAGADGRAFRWTLPGCEQAVVLRGHRGAVRAIAASHDGALVATAGADRTARLWDAETGALLRVMTVGARLRGVAFSADDRRIVTVGGDERVLLWEVVRDRRAVEALEALARRGRGGVR